MPRVVSAIRTMATNSQNVQEEKAALRKAIREKLNKLSTDEIARQCTKPLWSVSQVVQS